MTTSSTPMAIEPTASQRGSPVKWARTTPPRARNRPISAPMSSSSTTGSSGCFDRRMNVHQHSAALTWCGLAVRRAQRERLEDDGEERGCRWRPAGSRPRADGGASRCPRRARTGRRREQHERDDERPEVALPPVAEGVVGVGGLAAPACRRAAGAPGCRCRPASGWPRQSSPPDVIGTRRTWRPRCRGVG